MFAAIQSLLRRFALYCHGDRQPPLDIAPDVQAVVTLKIMGMILRWCGSMTEKSTASIQSIEVHFAPANFEDWPALLDLLQRSFAYMDGRIDPPSSLNAMTPGDLAAKASREQLVMARHGGHLIGCGFFAVHPAAIYLSKLAVDENFRGQGILKSIVSLADEMARKYGKPLLELQTRVELTKNHKTFRAVGFVVVGTTTHAGFDRPTSLTMQRRVSALQTDGGLAPALREHNGGPPLDDPEDHVPPWGKHGIRTYFKWRKARQAAWKVSPDIAKRRVRLAQACGLTYEEYTSALLDTGHYLQPGDTDLIAAIIARR